MHQIINRRWYITKFTWNWRMTCNMWTISSFAKNNLIAKCLDKTLYCPKIIEKLIQSPYVTRYIITLLISLQPVAEAISVGWQCFSATSCPLWVVQVIQLALSSQLHSSISIILSNQWTIRIHVAIPNVISWAGGQKLRNVILYEI